MKPLIVLLMFCVSNAAGQNTREGRDPTQFIAPNGAVFFIHGATLVVKSGIPFFRATVQNPSSSGWKDVIVDVGVIAKCPGTDSRRIEFDASLGYLRPGETTVSDTIVSARRTFGPGCELGGLDVVKFKSGAVETEEATRAREEQRKRSEADQKRIRVEADADQKQALSEIDAEARKRAEIIANCHTVFLATADKKVSDLTVREEQAVRACQVLGYYE